MDHRILTRELVLEHSLLVSQLTCYYGGGRKRSAPPTVAFAAPLLQQSGWLTLVRSVRRLPFSLVPLCVLVVGELL